MGISQSFTNLKTKKLTMLNSKEIIQSQMNLNLYLNAELKISIGQHLFLGSILLCKKTVITAKIPTKFTAVKNV
jgi:hypothetical protein